MKPNNTLRIILILYVLITYSSISHAQNRKICGMITNTKGEVVAGEIVCLKGGEFCTNTDESGNYCIEIPVDENDIVFQVSHMNVKNIIKVNGAIYNIVVESFMYNLFELSLEDLMNIEVVSSTKVAQKQSFAPNVISVFNKSHVQAYGWNSLNDILYKQSGFFPSQDYERSTVGSRGIGESWSQNHLLLLVDGIPMNTGMTGQANTTEVLPLIFTKTFEVIKGPGSALYGSNATNGVITLNTISANDFDKNKVFLNLKYGENNTAFYDVITTFKTKPFAITASLSYNHTDGEQYMSYDGSEEFDESTSDLKLFQPKYKRNSAYFFTKLEGKESLEGLSLQLHSQHIKVNTGFGWLLFVPDRDEAIKDSNTSFTVKYNKDITNKINVEAVVKYSHQIMDWDATLYRKGALDNFYPDGVSEYVKASADHIFTRLQFMFKLPQNSSLLVATEPSFFIYGGDEEHYSNIDLFSEATNEVVSNGGHQLGPLLEPIENRTVKNMGSFAQFSSGNLLGDYIQATAGIRYDIEAFDYVDVNSNGKNIVSKQFDELSPRLSLVIAPSDRLTFKLLAVTAFRAPAPTELFAKNSWLYASNINELTSERIKSGEIAVNYQAKKNLTFRLNTYYTISEGQIAYSISNYNLSTNVYDLTNAGIEVEALYSKKDFSTFANLSYVKRIDETIHASKADYSEHKNILTWAPALTANFGATQIYKGFKFSIQGHYQGEVLRRDTDFYSQEHLAMLNLEESPRPEKVADWFALDTQVTYKYKFVEFGISGKNLFNTDNYLVKNLRTPFDYKMEGRRLSAVLNFEF